MGRLKEYIDLAEAARRSNENAPGKVQLINKRLKERFDSAIEGADVVDETVAKVSDLIEWLNQREKDLL